MFNRLNMFKSLIYLYYIIICIWIFIYLALIINICHFDLQWKISAFYLVNEVIILLNAVLPFILYSSFLIPLKFMDSPFRSDSYTLKQSLFTRSLPSFFGLNLFKVGRGFRGPFEGLSRALPHWTLSEPSLNPHWTLTKPSLNPH